MTLQKRTLQTPHDRARFITDLKAMNLPLRVATQEGDDRSPSQNATLHMWFGEIARQKEGETSITVKGMCHRKYGLAIRLRDDKFSWIWERTGAAMGYEKQCALLASGILSVSSQMTKPELSEYLEAMATDYRADGYRLTDPEMLKYENGK